ncbi:MAG: PKD domain-containing protein, partial [Patescibacteria group bacterium]
WTPPTVVNNPPIAKAGTDITALVNQEISFDGSQSSDQDYDTLTYFWNFGDGATDTEKISTHIYTYPGQYIVSLLVNDGELSNLDVITVNVYAESIIISEFNNEWIELYNQSDQIANLSNWQLDGQEQGSSTPFVFPPNSLIAPNQFLVLTQQITKLVLNNNNDQVRLIYPDGSVATEISYYTEEKQGLSIAFNGSDYFWTKTPTPGSVNIISSTDLNNQNENISSNNPEPIIKETKEIPETLTNINLTQSKNLSVINPLTEPDNCLTDSCTIEQSPLIEEQTASLARTTQSSQKSKLILYISIIISASLIISWGLIRLRNRDKERP